MTAYALSGWPDLIVGLGIAAMNADAYGKVWNGARENTGGQLLNKFQTGKRG